MITSRNNLRLHRKRRIRAKVSGTAERPRLSIFRSLAGMEVQLIDDEAGKTILGSTIKKIKAKNNLEGAKLLGADIAKKAIAKKISEIVFDRGGYKYHGKVKALADGARTGGLKF